MKSEVTFGNDKDCNHKEKKINIRDVIIFLKMTVSVTMATMMMAEMMTAYSSNSKVELLQPLPSITHHNVMRIPGSNAQCLTSMSQRQEHRQDMTKQN